MVHFLLADDQIDFLEKVRLLGFRSSGMVGNLRRKQISSIHTKP
jgi:hypothetical protein